MLFCDTPVQSAVAAVIGGLVGGLTAVSLGLGTVGVAVLAGVLGGAGDMIAHLVRRDEQFEEAVSRVRR
ncbi:MAG: putative oligopeptide transporter (OPT) family protein [Methanobacteriota archaeon]|jgi:uncharacterized oligopeptide transporter (OPT) family protein|uniref:Uncharacterized protein n=1 Tax=Halorutilus salinus TaxID=2487751 RepID=A0A9Q4C579_9EURY|nr:hypothetical protein [Halorutilus salinus]MCX2819678.1 hypothetical protein [Halorutilus salinus]